ncbi:MAG: DUF4395 family protein [Candidatus Kapaibacteriota bacterium]|jgi:hypothetical protein
MSESRQNLASKTQPLDIPLPIVQFSRVVYVAVLVTAFALQTPLLTTILLAIVIVGVVGGAGWNVINRAGRLLLQKRIKSRTAVPLEDVRLIRFNNLIVIGLLGAAQVTFWVTKTPVVGWVFVGFIVAACVAALSGYCVGCTLYYQFKLHKYKFLGEA